MVPQWLMKHHGDMNKLFKLQFFKGIATILYNYLKVTDNTISIAMIKIFDTNHASSIAQIWINAMLRMLCN